MVSGKVPWIHLLTDTESGEQGGPGILHFYKFDGDQAPTHMNYGVGQTDGEPTSHVADATITGWMVERNKEPDRQVHAAEAESVNLTFVPYSRKMDPVAQAVILWNVLEQKKREWAP